MLDSFAVPQWIQSVIQEIQEGDDARVELVILNRTPPRPRTFLDRLRNAGQLPFSVYSKLDTWIMRKRTRLDAFAAADISELIRDVPVVGVVPIQKRWTDRFEADDIEAVKEARLDVILRFGFRILKGEVLLTARYGVWSFHHDDNRLYRGGPALFWEMYEGNPESGTILQALTEDLDGGRVLYRSTSATDFTSLYRNRNSTYWKTARFIGRSLRDLRRFGLDALLERRSDAPYQRGIYRTPGATAMTRFIARTAWRNLETQIRQRLATEDWFIAYTERPAALLRARPRFKTVVAPAGRFYADPFVVDAEGTSYIFFEDFSYLTGKGVVSCLELREGRAASPRVVLERPYHLSYPSVFSWSGQWYMTPETEENRTVELYRAVDFPWTWELAGTLLEGIQAVDPTVFHHGGLFWMFATVAATGASWQDELSLFHSEKLEGPWRPHARNPVVSDVRHARPAGYPFFENGILYRPSQDCAVSYGHSITINRVDVLNPEQYRETPVTTIDPSWLEGSLCTHTLNASERWLVTDGKRRKWRLRPRPASMVDSSR
jgi:hypothetical protein